MKFSELQSKDVINVNTGQIIGSIVDLIITDDGKIESLIIEKTIWGKLYRSLGGKNSTIINFSNITSIGKDVIFVNYI